MKPLYKMLLLLLMLYLIQNVITSDDEYDKSTNPVVRTHDGYEFDRIHLYQTLTFWLEELLKSNINVD